MSTLAQKHDSLLLDLDGTVYRGHETTPAPSLKSRRVTARALFVTNNASRAPDEVARHLRAWAFAMAAEIVTAPQSGRPDC